MVTVVVWSKVHGVVCVGVHRDVWGAVDGSVGRIHMGVWVGVHRGVG